MRLYIGEIKTQVDEMNAILINKSSRAEELLTELNGLINEDELEGKVFDAMKDYFRMFHIPIVKGLILAYGEIKTANTNLLNDLYTQVSSDESYQIDADNLATLIQQQKVVLRDLEEKALELNVTMPAAANTTNQYVQQQRTNLASLESEIQKLENFNNTHLTHYSLAELYLENVATGINRIKGRSFDPNTKVIKYDTSNMSWSQALNNGWKLKKAKKAKADNNLTPASDVSYISVDVSKYSPSVQKSIKECLEGMEKYRDDEVMLEYQLSALENILDYANGYGQIVESFKERLKGITSGSLQAIGGGTEVVTGAVLFAGTSWQWSRDSNRCCWRIYGSRWGEQRNRWSVSAIKNSLKGNNEGDTANFMKNAYKKISVSCGQDKQVGENIYNLTQLGIGIYSV